MNTNISNYFKPSKYINFLQAYPRLQNLLKIKNKNIRLLMINFYKYFVKKNNNLRFYFFGKSKKDLSIIFDKKDLIHSNDKVFNSLASNGIVIITNVLQQEERNKILNYFNEIQYKKFTTDWINKEIIDASSIKYKNKKKVEILSMHKDTKFLPEISEINNLFTEKIFGRSMKTVAEFFLHNCINNEEENTHEDTNFHIDRYLPCLKIIYSPNTIDENDAPFGFIKKNHKLDDNFMNKFLLNTEKFFINNNELNEDLKKNIVSTICPENSLIITFTNGLHKRNIFKKNDNMRKTIFFQFTKNFNTFSLINYKKFN